ncbi:hypothetical protein BSL78_30054 [Apostichopus japonicus]|uniref:WKF domain-containing protein n=1 Tax=Stichopus japonicus TaxID=307972 RepID=A0A2G8JBM0_STIJA|nr:hypothetical protein BSL78_30054 [Apostichopus japonicus]
MTMSEGDVQKKQVRKNRNKKKAKQGAKPEDVVMEKPPSPVEETAPQQTNKKGRKRKEGRKGGRGVTVSKSDNIALSNDSIEEKDGQPEKGEVVDEEMTDASLGDKKKWRKKRHGKKDTSDVVDTLDKMDTAKTSEEGNTGNPEVKTSPKRKGKNKQKKKKKKEGEGGGGSTPQSDSQRPCLRYLQLWDKERDSWHFQKVRQVWLLQNMYDKVKVGGVCRMLNCVKYKPYEDVVLI